MAAPGIGRTARVSPPAVEAIGLRRIYGAGAAEVVALDAVSLRVAQGEVVAVMGPSGSGKTTLLSVLGGILRPTAGRVFLEGHEVSAMPEATRAEARRRLVGFIFQAFNLFAALTARENVELVLNLHGVRGREARERSRALLEAVGLERRAGHLPRDLSGGEKQRVSIARALAGSPPIVLADEPTGNLDWKTGQRIVELLIGEARARGRAVVVVTHDTRIETMADRVLRLEDGRLAGEVAA